MQAGSYRMNDFKLLYSRQLATELRSDTLERLVTTEAIACETLIYVLGIRLFGLKKPKAIVLEKCGKISEAIEVSPIVTKLTSNDRTRLVEQDSKSVLSRKCR
jgi:hypothetical protein